ncbi:isochorismatase family protein [Heliobacterium chlorum]|uniref:Isochorismatase family protein n=1 Tax=Heliobacterium chlorum TaxID=2698 RepID=A0ABR7T0N5_HELCL|nr:isochorismatase family protein [Heliobacterium chlorum]MBC9784246.1 isochorismatase family protein [Heliobacterium chlorum]
MDKYYLDAKSTVLMIIDIQERLYAVMERGNEVVRKTGVLIAAAKRLGVPIIYVEMYPKGLGRMVTALADNLKDAHHFEKITFSGCTGEVMSCLVQMKRRKIIVAGMETHVCVFQTVRDLLRDKYRVFVVSDAVCSRDDDNRRNGLELMASMGAVVTNTETVFFDLLKRAGTELFKELSPLIK